MPEANLPRFDRRITIKWMLTAVAAGPLLKWNVGNAASAQSKGYGTDPDLLKTYSPGDLWPLTLTTQLQSTAAALCDVIIPADAHSPSASAVGVVAFIDEWMSAPYPRHEQDRSLIVSGLQWLDAEAQRRHSRLFAELGVAEHSTLCDRICYLPEAQPALLEPAKFFARYRDLTAAGFYTTPAGHTDVQYVGNAAMASFEGPPREVLKAAGLV